MAHRRTLRIDYEKTTNVLCVVGTEINVNLDRYVYFMQPTSHPQGAQLFVKERANECIQ